MPVSTRTRFEIFKRDAFTCRYCGRKSPEVILEIDHITPICDGGTDDTINLATSCWECNRGKAGVPLAEVLTGEDPHEKAILILEKERQLAEYNHALGLQRERQADDLQRLVNHWCKAIGRDYLRQPDASFLKFCVKVCPVEQVLEFMDIARAKGIYRLQYVSGCLKKWRAENEDTATI